MTKGLVATVGLAICLAGTTGCMAVASPAVGTLYTEVTWDGDAEGAVGSKEGKACATSILGLVADGDASLAAAAADGGIRNITRVDHYTRNLLGIIGEYCTIVGGS